MKLNIVPARTGIQWVKLGVQTFMKQPLALTGLFFMYMAVVLVISQIPVIGPVLAAMLVPAATLGLMVATSEAASGRFPMPTVLISGFRAGRERLRAMLVLGVIFTAGAALLGALSALIIGDLPEPAARAGATPDPAGAARMLASLVLHLPLYMLFWHAPALVHWHGISPVKSLFFSAVACLRNAGAFIVYGFTWVGVFMVFGLVVSLLAALLGGQSAANTILIPLVLLMLAMVTTSVYFTFRDCFRADDAEETAPGPGGETTP
ncbi:MAG TPA: BPSS1780 family membrane protein [Ramlibacter sp.]